MVALSAPKTPAASAAPAGMRSTLWNMSHSESTPGILSAKNSVNSRPPLAISMTGCSSTCRPPGRSIQPRAPSAPTTNTTRYSRKPLAQPSAAARASRLAMSMPLAACPTACAAWVALSTTALPARSTVSGSGCRPMRCSQSMMAFQMLFMVGKGLAVQHPLTITSWACVCRERPAPPPCLRCWRGCRQCVPRCRGSVWR